MPGRRHSVTDNDHPIEPTTAPTADRFLEFEIEVVGTPEEVWQAIATGPGISAWYVPHTVEEREGGSATASFGEGPEMQISGRVAAWEPPHRVVFDKGDGEPGLAFEWLIEAREGGTCIVRLVNTGFGSGDDWDAQYDGLAEGWKLFLLNLQLHLAHFPGRAATSMLPMAMWAGSREATWARLTDALGIAASPSVGDPMSVSAAEAPALAGTVIEAASWRVALLLNEPCPGTAFIAVEGTGQHVGVSIWSYLYGPDRDPIASRDVRRWQQWLDEHANPAAATGHG
jgi:uncharacterized protein YndB with AHSA1/START domain